MNGAEFSFSAIPPFDGIATPKREEVHSPKDEASFLPLRKKSTAKKIAEIALVVLGVAAGAATAAIMFTPLSPLMFGAAMSVVSVATPILITYGIIKGCQAIHKYQKKKLIERFHRLEAETDHLIEAVNRGLTDLHGLRALRVQLYEIESKIKSADVQTKLAERFEQLDLIEKIKNCRIALDVNRNAVQAELIYKGINAFLCNSNHRQNLTGLFHLLLVHLDLEIKHFYDHKIAAPDQSEEGHVLRDKYKRYLKSRFYGGTPVKNTKRPSEPEVPNIPIE